MIKNRKKVIVIRRWIKDDRLWKYGKIWNESTWLQLKIDSRTLGNTIKFVRFKKDCIYYNEYNSNALYRVFLKFIYIKKY